MRNIFMILFFFSILYLEGTNRIFYKNSFIAENSKYLIIHHWELGKSGTITKDSDRLFLNKRKSISYLILIIKDTGKVIFKKSSSFFTYGWISPDSKYIVLLSNLKISEKNPHIALLSIKGKVLFKKRISSLEFVLNKTEYKEFKGKFPKFVKSLLENNAVSASYKLDKIYIQSNVFIENKKIDRFLSNKEKNNHLSNCIHVSSRPLSSWFYLKIIMDVGEKKIIGMPDIKLRRNMFGDVIGVSLLDSCKKRIVIPIMQKNKEGILLPIK